MPARKPHADDLHSPAIEDWLDWYADPDPTDDWRRFHGTLPSDRQIELRRCLATPANPLTGIFPFRDVPLDRQDVEWLLDNHVDPAVPTLNGPVLLGRPGHENRNGLDLRGAILNRVDLSELPLARVRFGLTHQEWRAPGQFLETHFKAAAHLEQVNFTRADLREAALVRARMNGADLGEAHLEGAPLMGARLENAYLGRAFLARADLTHATFNHDTRLENTMLGDGSKGGGPVLVDLNWDDVRLDRVKWESVPILGDTFIATKWTADDYAKLYGRTLDDDELKARHFERLLAGVRANRQVAVALRNQGLYDAADPFAYQAQVLQRKVWWWKKARRKWVVSKALDYLYGYGYNLKHLGIVYVAVVLLFALLYFLYSLSLPHSLSFLEAALASFTAIHGRVFIGLPEFFGVDSVLAWAAGVEALLGIIIEGVFVAIVVQRLVGR